MVRSIGISAAVAVMVGGGGRQDRMAARQRGGQASEPQTRRVGRKFGALGLCSVPATAIAGGIWKPEKG